MGKVCWRLVDTAAACFTKSICVHLRKEIRTEQLVHLGAAERQIAGSQVRHLLCQHRTASVQSSLAAISLSQHHNAPSTRLKHECTVVSFYTLNFVASAHANKIWALFLIIPHSWEKKLPEITSFLGQQQLPGTCWCPWSSTNARLPHYGLPPPGTKSSGVGLAPIMPSMWVSLKISTVYTSKSNGWSWLINGWSSLIQSNYISVWGILYPMSGNTLWLHFKYEVPFLEVYGFEPS